MGVWSIVVAAVDDAEADISPGIPGRTVAISSHSTTWIVEVMKLLASSGVLMGELA